MSSIRAVRIAAGLGVSGALAATGLVVAGPSANAAPGTTTVSPTYHCVINAPGQPAFDFDVPAVLTLPTASGTFVAGQKLPALQLATGSVSIPKSLLVLLVNQGPTLTAFGVRSLAVDGPIEGSSLVGAQKVPTAVSAPQDDALNAELTSLLTVPPSDQASVIAGLPDSLAVSGLTGGTKAAALTAVGKNLSVKLPTTITANLISALVPVVGDTKCTTTDSTALGTITVTKAKAKFGTAKLAKKTVAAKKKAQVKATVVNASKTSIKPTGKVTAFVGKKKVGSGALKNGAAKFSLEKLKKGAYKIVLKYTGSKQFSAAKNTTVKLKVTK